MQSTIAVCYSASRSYLPYLEASLASLPNEVEKVVIWYDPKDKAPTFSASNLRVIEWKTKLQNWQKAKAMNLAVKKAQSEWVLLADADMLFPDFLFPILERKLLETEPNMVFHFFVGRLTRRRSQAILAREKRWADYCEKYEGAVEYTPPSFRAKVLAKLCRTLTRVLYIEYGTNKIGYDLIFGSINPCVFNKEFFLNLGGYNTQFVGWGGEDDDLDKRARKHGAIDIRLPILVAHLWHPRVMDFENYLTESTAYGKRK